MSYQTMCRPATKDMYIDSVFTIGTDSSANVALTDSTQVHAGKLTATYWSTGKIIQLKWKKDRWETSKGEVLMTL